MNAQDKYPDGPPCVAGVPHTQIHYPDPKPFAVLDFEGGPVDTSRMRASHNGPTPTTATLPGQLDYAEQRYQERRNAKLTRPAEQYPGEAERMIAEMTRLATASIQRARDATELPRLLAELDQAAWLIAQARRWATP